jgi:hypothetical protein
MKNLEAFGTHPNGPIERFRNFWHERQERRRLETIVGGFALIGAVHVEEGFDTKPSNKHASSFIIAHS